jgi:protein TonB
MMRLAVALVVALAVNAALFYLMQAMITGQDPNLAPTPLAQLVDFVPAPAPAPAPPERQRPALPPEPEVTPPQPPVPPDSPPDPIAVDPVPVEPLPVPELPVEPLAMDPALPPPPPVQVAKPQPKPKPRPRPVAKSSPKPEAKPEAKPTPAPTRPPVAKATPSSRPPGPPARPRYVQAADLVPVARTAPRYPERARRRRLEGRVLVEFRVDERGRVRDPRIVESRPPGVFDDTVLRTVARWRFRPQKVGGEAVAVLARQELTFELAGR